MVRKRREKKGTFSFDSREFRIFGDFRMFTSHDKKAETWFI